MSTNHKYFIRGTGDVGVRLWTTDDGSEWYNIDSPESVGVHDRTLADAPARTEYEDWLTSSFKAREVKGCHYFKFMNIKRPRR